MKDQSLRKLQQEMDSLTFRNLQLAKRVELLQDELALSEPRGKKNKVSRVEAPGWSVEGTDWCGQQSHSMPSVLHRCVWYLSPEGRCLPLIRPHRAIFPFPFVLGTRSLLAAQAGLRSTMFSS